MTISGSDAIVKMDTRHNAEAAFYKGMTINANPATPHWYNEPAPVVQDVCLPLLPLLFPNLLLHLIFTHGVFMKKVTPREERNPFLPLPKHVFSSNIVFFV